MPCKKRKNVEIEPVIPDFDAIMNFPLKVMVEDCWGNKKKMFMDNKLQLMPLDALPTDVTKDIDNSINDLQTKLTQKSILKVSNDTDKENVVKRKSQSKVMFSSPLIKNTPNSKSDLRKHLLIEQLKQCQETPILPVKSDENLIHLNDSSFQFVASTPPTTVLTGEPLLMDDCSTATHSMDKSSKEEQMYQMVKIEDRKKWMIAVKRRSRWTKKVQGVNDSFWEVYHADDPESMILKLCQSTTTQSFANVFPTKNRKKISKLGEGSFGEVFSIVDSDNKISVAKFVPVEGKLKYNGGPQTTFSDIISEIVVAKELSDMKIGTVNRCKNFVQVKNVSLVTGKFPTYFQKEWDKSNKIKSSENDNPKKFSSDQKWIVIQFEFAGSPLENFELISWGQAYSILIQACLSLACAENYLEFEHRDLHWGNLLILEKNKDDPHESIIVDGKEYSFDHQGVQSTIIDFTFSRIKKGINLVFTDMSKDKDIFLGTGDLQFDIYRQMQTHNKDDWESFNPKTNIFWLSYLGEKIVELISAKKSSIVNDKFKEKFESLVSDISNCESANQLIRQHMRSE